MKNSSLPRLLFCALAALAALFATGFSNSAFAGPERYPDLSKEKNIVPMPVCDPRWYFSIGGGIDIDFQATDLVNGTDFEPYAGDPYYIENYRSRSYDDVYGDSLFRIQAEVGYVLTNHIEVFGLFKYAHGSGKSLDDVDMENFGTENYPIRTDFGDYNSWGGEIGFRYFFFSKETAQAWHVRPYVSVSGGATFVDSIHATSRYLYLSVTDQLPAFEGNLYDSSVVGTAAGMLGLEIPINCHWAFGVEGGVRYESQLDNTDVIRRTFSYYDQVGSGAQGTYTLGGNPEHYNNAGDRLYFPANVYLKFRF